MRDRGFAVLFFLLAFQTVVRAQQSCGDPSNTIGFSTLGGLRENITRLGDQFDLGTNVEDTYIFIICPNTVFDIATDGQFIPGLVNNMKFYCGNPPNLNNNCVFSGSNPANGQQILIQNNALTEGASGITYQLLSVEFIGFTFQEVVADHAVLVEKPDITFKDCLWKNTTALNLLRINSNQPGNTLLENCAVQDGNIDEELFRMFGAGLTLADCTISNMAMGAFSTTGTSGSLTIVNSGVIGCTVSGFGFMFSVDAGSLDVSNLIIGNMIQLPELMFTILESATASLDQLLVLNNDNSSGNNFTVLQSRISATTSVSNSEIVDNINLRRVFRVSEASSLDLSGVSIYRNTQEIGANADELIEVENSELVFTSLRIEENSGYSGVLAANGSSIVSGSFSCFSQMADLSSVVLVSQDTDSIFTDVFVEDTVSSIVCSPPGAFIAQEEQGSNCGSGVCNVMCVAATGNDQSCLLDQSSVPSSTVPPLSVSPSSAVPTILPSPTVQSSPTSAPSSSTCAVPVREFRSSVVLDVMGNADEASAAELAALEQAFSDSYNSLNTPSGDVCDPFRRTITSIVETTVAPRMAQRHLSDAATPSQRQLQMFPSFGNRFQVLVQVRANCRGCPANQDLFDDVSRRSLEASLASGNKRDLQSRCDCPPGSEQRGPTESEFAVELDDSIQELRDSGSIDFINSLAGIDETNCTLPRTEFTSSVLVEVRGNSRLGNAQQLEKFETAFLETYNDLNGEADFCDTSRRTLLSVIDATAVTRHRSLAAEDRFSRRLGEPNFGFFAMLVVVTGVCRGCGNNPVLFNDISGRRQLQPSRQLPTTEIFTMLLDQAIQVLRESGEITFITSVLDVEETEDAEPLPAGSLQMFFSGFPQTGPVPSVSGSNKGMMMGMRSRSRRSSKQRLMNGMVSMSGTTGFLGVPGSLGGGGMGSRSSSASIDSTEMTSQMRMKMTMSGGMMGMSGQMGRGDNESGSSDVSLGFLSGVLAGDEGEEAHIATAQDEDEV